MPVLPDKPGAESRRNALRQFVTAEWLANGKGAERGIVKSVAQLRAPAMSWETRKGHRYYYHARRVDGRLVKTYIGSGNLVEHALKIRSDEKVQRWRDRRDDEEQEESERAQEWDRQRLFDQVNTVVTDLLQAAGYHRHKGQWRKRRRQTMTAMTATNNSLLSEWDDDKLPAVVPVLNAKERKMHEKGDKSVLPKVRKSLTANAERARRWGDLAAMALTRMLNNVGWPSLRDKEAVRRRAIEIRLALAGPRPNPIEALLAERAAICWVDVYLCDQAAQASSPTYVNKGSFEAHDRRRSRADRRFLNALKTLAVVRRLKLPDLMAVVQVQGRK